MFEGIDDYFFYTEPYTNKTIIADMCDYDFLYVIDEEFKGCLTYNGMRKKLERLYGGIDAHEFRSGLKEFTWDDRFDVPGNFGTDGDPDEDASAMGSR